MGKVILEFENPNLGGAEIREMILNALRSASKEQIPEGTTFSYVSGKEEIKVGQDLKSR